MLQGNFSLVVGVGREIVGHVVRFREMLVLQDCGEIVTFGLEDLLNFPKTPCLQDGFVSRG
jgi:hypothetical protein